MEEWTPIAGWLGWYEVSSMGRVRSVARWVPMMTRWGTLTLRRVASRILTAHTWGAPYPGVVLVCGDRRARRMVHQLVAEAFIPNPQGFDQVNHLDADTRNACVGNLEWCDQSHNLKHAYATGRRPVGKEHHFANLARDEQGRCVARG